MSKDRRENDAYKAYSWQRPLTFLDLIMNGEIGDSNFMSRECISIKCENRCVIRVEKIKLCFWSVIVPIDKYTCCYSDVCIGQTLYMDERDRKNDK